MWNELEGYKHKFLQMQLKDMKPTAISPLVQEEFKKAQARRAECQFPKEKLQMCEKSSYFEDHATLSYGDAALPKLLLEIRSDVPSVRSAAITSLAEFLMNPFNAQQALRKTEIIRLLKNALLRRHYRFTSAEFNVSRLMECFRILSYYHNAAIEIVKYQSLVDTLYLMMAQDKMHAEVATTILRNLSEKPDIKLHLYENTDSFTKLKIFFHRDPCRPKYSYNLWVHLNHFVEIAPERAIEFGFFHLMHQRIVKKLPEYYGMAMKCFAFTIRCEAGQRLFDEVDGISLLYNMMSDEKEALGTYEYIVMAFLHGLQSRDAMRRCTEFVDLPKIMTKYILKINRGNARLQLYAMKVMRQLGEIPSIKDYMRENCEKHLRTMVCYKQENDFERVKLVQWLNRGIYETSCNPYFREPCCE